MDNKERIFALSEAIGPSGDETGAAAVAKQLLRPYVDSVTQDVNGNVIGIRTAKQRGARCLLLDAHLDEVGMTVSGYDNGFLQFVPIGLDLKIQIHALINDISPCNGFTYKPVSIYIYRIYDIFTGL